MSPKTVFPILMLFLVSGLGGCLWDKGSPEPTKSTDDGKNSDQGTEATDGTDTGKSTDEPDTEPASLEPETVTVPNTGLSEYAPISDLKLAVGGSDGQIAVSPGAEDELPQGPASFDVDSSGNVYILDSVSSTIKSFQAGGTPIGKINLVKDRAPFLDFSLAPSGEMAVYQAATDLVFVLPKGANQISQATPVRSLSSVQDFSGVFYNNDSQLFARDSGQMTYKVSSSGVAAPYLALLSMRNQMFFRTNLAPTSGVLYASKQLQASGYQGNAEKKYEITMDRPILSVTYIDSDSQGRPYLRVETDDSATVEQVKVKRYVMRVGSKPEDWTKPIEIPSDVYALPFRDIRIGADGSVYAMLVYQDRIEVKKWAAK
ncbi:MAG: hypothetical protein PHU25_04040 [Deltaproteobacteria bacterium]|nr:hypothetical protein [Deltaproteobacteria bacterium]